MVEEGSGRAGATADAAVPGAVSAEPVPTTGTLAVPAATSLARGSPFEQAAASNASGSSDLAERTGIAPGTCHASRSGRKKTGGVFAAKRGSG